MNKLKIRFVRTNEYEVVLDLSDPKLQSIVAALQEDFDAVDYKFYRNFKEYIENTLFDMLYNEGYNIDPKAAKEVNRGMMLIRTIDIIKDDELKEIE